MSHTPRKATILQCFSENEVDLDNQWAALRDTCTGLLGGLVGASANDPEVRKRKHVVAHKLEHCYPKIFPKGLKDDDDLHRHGSYALVTYCMQTTKRLNKITPSGSLDQHPKQTGSVNLGREFVLKPKPRRRQLSPEIPDESDAGPESSKVSSSDSESKPEKNHGYQYRTTTKPEEKTKSRRRATLEEVRDPSPAATHKRKRQFQTPEENPDYDTRPGFDSESELDPEPKLERESKPRYRSTPKKVSDSNLGPKPAKNHKRQRNHSTPKPEREHKLRKFSPGEVSGEVSGSDVQPVRKRKRPQVLALEPEDRSNFGSGQESNTTVESGPKSTYRSTAGEVFDPNLKSETGEGYGHQSRSTPKPGEVPRPRHQLTPGETPGASPRKFKLKYPQLSQLSFTNLDPKPEQIPESQHQSAVGHDYGSNSKSVEQGNAVAPSISLDSGRQDSNDWLARLGLYFKITNSEGNRFDWDPFLVNFSEICLPGVKPSVEDASMSQLQKIIEEEGYGVGTYTLLGDSGPNSVSIRNDRALRAQLNAFGYSRQRAQDSSGVISCEYTLKMRETHPIELNATPAGPPLTTKDNVATKDELASGSQPTTPLPKSSLPPGPLSKPPSRSSSKSPTALPPQSPSGPPAPPSSQSPSRSSSKSPIALPPQSPSGPPAPPSSQSPSGSPPASPSRSSSRSSPASPSRSSQGLPSPSLVLDARKTTGAIDLKYPPPEPNTAKPPAGFPEENSLQGYNSEKQSTRGASASANRSLRTKQLGGLYSLECSHDTQYPTKRPKLEEMRADFIEEEELTPPHSEKTLTALERFVASKDLSALNHFVDSEWSRDICPAIFAQDHTDPTAKLRFPGVKLTLFPHQIVGIWWCLKQQNTVFRSGVIGDEMGFGKSAQVAGFLEGNAQLLELQHDIQTQRDHNPDTDMGAGLAPQPCKVRDSAGPDWHRIQCPCESEALRRMEGIPGPTLITCPPSLLANLAKELYKFADLKIIRFNKPHNHAYWVHNKEWLSEADWKSLVARDEDSLRANSRTIFLVASQSAFAVLSDSRISAWKSLNASERREFEKTIESYRSMGFNNADAINRMYSVQGSKRKSYRRRVFRIPFARVIMDEAHRIIQAGSKNLTFLKFLGVPFWFVSGSAVNMVPEKWDGWRGLMEDGEWRFDSVAQKYTTNGFKRLKKRFKAWQTQLDNFEGESGALSVADEWAEFLQCFALRRCSKDKLWDKPLLDLPDHNIKDIQIKILGDKAVCAAYEKLSSIAQLTIDRERLKGEDRISQGRSIWRRLRLASTIPAIFILPQLKEQQWLKEEVLHVSKLEDKDPFRQHLQDIIRMSPKLQWLQDFVQGERLGLSGSKGFLEQKDGSGVSDKLLIFSASPAVLHCVDLCLEEWGLKVGKAWSASPEERSELFIDFQGDEEPRVLTGTYQTMSEGATLTRACTCIMMDPDWTIAAENQAKGRIHRVGQRRLCTTYRLISVDAFDARVIAAQRKGQKLNNEAFSKKAECGSEDDFVRKLEDRMREELSRGPREEVEPHKSIEKSPSPSVPLFGLNYYQESFSFGGS